MKRNAKHSRSSQPFTVAGPRVLACEDSHALREFLTAGLQDMGIHIRCVPDGTALEHTIVSFEPEIVIMDLGLASGDGFQLTARLRERNPRIGIILLTAKDEVEDRIRGLDFGADLYFSKPVELRELASGIASLHRRIGTVSAWQLDLQHSRLRTPKGAEVGLTDLELRFLRRLLDHPGDVVSREELCHNLDYLPDLYAMRRMDTLVSRLRAKVLRLSPEEPLPVKARHSKGYAFLG